MTTAIVVGLIVIVALLGVLVVGLLRSHAEILRALHDLGVNLRRRGARPRAARPARATTEPSASGLVPPRPGGLGSARRRHRPVPGGGVAHVAVRGVEHATLLAFLSTGCGTCGAFWEALGDPQLQLPDPTTRVVIVTSGPEAESPAPVHELAPPGVVTVMSSEAWDDYGVPVSPYFVLVDGPSGRIVGEGSGTSWDQVVDLLGEGRRRRRTEPVRSPAWAARTVRPWSTASCGRGHRARRPEPLPGRLARRGRAVTVLTDERHHVDLPPGWDGQIRPLDTPDPLPDPLPAPRRWRRPSGADEPMVLHAASFALPAERGDYGSGAVEVMGGSDILVCLLEHERAAAGDALFARDGIPRLTPDLFSPQTMQRAIPGMAGAQHFFQLAGRPFCLYVVVGSWHTRNPLVRTADRVASSIRIADLTARNRTLWGTAALAVASRVHRGRRARARRRRPRRRAPARNHGGDRGRGVELVRGRARRRSPTTVPSWWHRRSRAPVLRRCSPARCC